MTNKKCPNCYNSTVGIISSDIHHEQVFFNLITPETHAPPLPEFPSSTEPPSLPYNLYKMIEVAKQPELLH